MTNITGYILAGGKSSRMGTDKGLNLLNGKAMIRFVIEQMHFCMKNIVIVSNNEEYNQLGFRVINDLIKDAGPAGGIYTALSDSSTENNFIISCDMPYVKSVAIQYLIDNSVKSDVNVAVSHNKLHPLFGIYKKSCADFFKKSVLKKELKLKNIFNALNCNLIDMSHLDKEKLSLFQNVNTKKDFLNAVLGFEAKIDNLATKAEEH